MKYSYSFLLIVLLYLGSFSSAYAQQLWSKAYGGPTAESLGGLTTLRTGGFLLSGYSTTASSLYFVRITAEGDTIWTKRRKIRNYTSPTASTLLCENQAGQVLFSGQVATGAAFPMNQSPYLGLLNTATGDTLWTRVQPASPTDAYTDVALGANGDFVLAANLQGHPRWLRMNATGQVVQQVALDYSSAIPGAVSRMARVAGGYWLVVQVSNNTSSVTKFIFVSDAGVRGPEYLAPSAVSASILSLIPVEDGNFLVLPNGTPHPNSPPILKLSPTFDDPIIFQELSQGYWNFGYKQAQRNTNGEYVIAGVWGAGGQPARVGLFTYNNQGMYISHLEIFKSLQPSDVTVKFSVDPLTGNYTVAAAQGYTDLLCTTYRGAVVTAATTPATKPLGHLYPNPVSADEVVSLEPVAALTGTLELTDNQGRTVRRWNAAPVSTGAGYQLSLHGLAAGVYHLHTLDQTGQRTVHKVLKSE